MRRDLPVLRENLGLLVLLGALGIGSFNTLLYLGLQSTTALNAMLLQSAQPAMILVTGAVLMRDHTSARQVGGVIVSIVGVLVILARGRLEALTGLRLNAGDGIVGVAIVLWSVYAVCLRRRPPVHALSFMAVTLAIGVLAIAPFYALEIASGDLIVPTTDSWLAIGYVCVFPSLLAYLCFNRGVELIGSAATGQYMNVMPIMGAGLAVLFLGEAFRPFHLVGMLLVGAGILLAGKGRRPHRPPGTPH